MKHTLFPRVCNEISERGKIEERGKAGKRRKSDEQRGDQSRMAREERRNHHRDDRMEAAACEGDISRNRGRVRPSIIGIASADVSGYGSSQCEE
jgi:hypothetical protein